MNNEERYDALWEIFYAEPKYTYDALECKTIKELDMQINTWVDEAPNDDWAEALMNATEYLDSWEVYTIASQFQEEENAECCEDSIPEPKEDPNLQMNIFKKENDCGCEDNAPDPRMAEWERKYSV